MRSAGAPVKGAVIKAGKWLLAADQVGAPRCGPSLRFMPRGVRLAIADSRLY
jgi:hypothetical protein